MEKFNDYINSTPLKELKTLIFDVNGFAKAKIEKEIIIGASTKFCLMLKKSFVATTTNVFINEESLEGKKLLLIKLELDSLFQVIPNAYCHSVSIFL